MVFIINIEGYFSFNTDTIVAQFYEHRILVDLFFKAWS